MVGRTSVLTWEVPVDQEEPWRRLVLELWGGRAGRSRVLAMVGRTSVLTWEVPVDQEEPWRRFLQELSGARHGAYTESRRRLGITAESIWLAPRRSGGGTAVVYL